MNQWIRDLKKEKKNLTFAKQTNIVHGTTICGVIQGFKRIHNILQIGNLVIVTFPVLQGAPSGTNAGSTLSGPL